MKQELTMFNENNTKNRGKSLIITGGPFSGKKMLQENIERSSNIPTLVGIKLTPLFSKKSDLAFFRALNKEGKALKDNSSEFRGIIFGGPADEYLYSDPVEVPDLSGTYSAVIYIRSLAVSAPYMYKRKGGLKIMTVEDAAFIDKRLLAVNRMAYGDTPLIVINACAKNKKRHMLWEVINKYIK